MFNIAAKVFEWFSNLISGLFAKSDEHKKLLEIVDKWEQLFQKKCDEVDKALKEVAKIREDNAVERDLYRRLSEEYYKCEESRHALIKANSELRVRVTLLEKEIKVLKQELRELKNGTSKN